MASANALLGGTTTKRKTKGGTSLKKRLENLQRRARMQNIKGKEAAWNLRYDRINHYLRVEVDGGTLTVEAVDTAGKVFDKWRLKKTGTARRLRKFMIISEARKPGLKQTSSLTVVEG